MTEPIYLQKAKKYDEKKDNVNGWIAQPKYDGVRIQVVFTGNDCKIYSRSVIKETGTFNEYTNKLNHIRRELLMLNAATGGGFTDTIIDGEALAYNQGDREQNFKYVTGTLNCDEEKCLNRQGDNEYISAVFYNLPSLNVEYRTALATLIALFKEYKGDFEYIKPTEYTIVHDGEHMVEFQKQIDAGGEGLILYNPIGKYKHSSARCQTSKDLIKIKDVNEREVLVVGMVEGTGKAEGMMGAFICEDYRGKRFNIGTGFTDDARIFFWANQDKCPFVIEMMYHSETEDAYRLPVMYRNRMFDKSVDDWNRSA